MSSVGRLARDARRGVLLSGPRAFARRAAARPAGGLYIAFGGGSPADPDLTPAARRFVREFGARRGEDGVLEAAQATETVLTAIARSDGTRASVLDGLRAAREQNGILGDFAFDR